MPSIPVLLAFGANLGDPIEQLSAAVRRVREHVEVATVSSVYRTEPVGIRDQPEFLNLALAGTTELPVYTLHARLQAIEAAMGRRRGEANAPRLIDIDLLAYGDLAIDAPGLTVPHPRLHERTFVLAPLAEIVPDWRHPLLGASPVTMLQKLPDPTAFERLGSLPA